MIVEITSKDNIMIFSRGHNSKDNIDLIQERRYPGSMVQFDNRDLVAMSLERDSFMESSESVYGRVHRIVVYHTTYPGCKKAQHCIHETLQPRIQEVERIMESGYSNSQEQTGL